MSKIGYKIPIILGLVAVLGLLVVACVPSDLQDSIKSTQADVRAIKADIAALKGDAGGKLDKVLAGDSDINQAERDIKEHVVRGRADFIAFNDVFDALNKRDATFVTAITGVPAKKDPNTGATIPAKPGLAQNIDAKLDQVIGIPAVAAVPEKTDPATDKVIPGKAAIPRKLGLFDDVNGKLDMLVGKPGVAAVPESKDAKTGKVTPAKPAVPPTPGSIEKIQNDLTDVKARLAAIEAKVAPAAPAASPTPAALPAPTASPAP